MKNEDWHDRLEDWTWNMYDRHTKEGAKNGIWFICTGRLKDSTRLRCKLLVKDA